jgi:hypothetical protein
VIANEWDDGLNLQLLIVVTVRIDISQVVVLDRNRDQRGTGVVEFPGNVVRAMGRVLCPSGRWDHHWEQECARRNELTGLHYNGSRNTISRLLVPVSGMAKASHAFQAAGLLDGRY